MPIIQLRYDFWSNNLDFFIGLTSRMFANVPRELGSIRGQVIPKTQKWYSMQPCLTLSTQHYKLKGAIQGMK